MLALRDNIDSKDIKMKYFHDALKKVKPSTSKEIETMYEEFRNQFRKTRSEEMKKDMPNYFG